MSVKLLTEHHLEFLSLKEATLAGSSVSTLVKMPPYLKSHVAAQVFSADDTCRYKVTDEA